LDKIGQKIQELLEKQQSLEAFYADNFSTDQSVKKNGPNYELYENFESYLLLL
jgi:hypothetical protein